MAMSRSGVTPRPAQGDAFLVGLNYVSCSPFRVPVARLSRRRRGLAAAQAVLEEG